MVVYSEREGISLRELRSWSDEDLFLEFRMSCSNDVLIELMSRIDGEAIRYLSRYLGNESDAWDAYNDAWLNASQKSHQFEEGRRFRPWFFAIATNCANDIGRRKRRHKHVSLRRAVRPSSSFDEDLNLDEFIAGDTEEPPDLSVRRERADWVRDALDTLNDPLRNVLVLVYMQGLKYREAAEVLHVPVGTVKSRIHTAVDRLSEYWNETHSQSEQTVSDVFSSQQ